MSKLKKLVGILLAVFMIVSMVQTGFVAFAEGRTVALTKYEVPGVNFSASGVIRVAASKNSLQAGSTIVAATPSGIPELGGELAGLQYAGETPSSVVLTLKVDKHLTATPTLICTNELVTFSEGTYANGQYTWTITGGIADAGTTLEFIATYEYQGLTYSAICYVYVEGITQPAGTYVKTENYRKKWYDTHRYFSTVSVYTRILGIGVYGTLSGVTAENGNDRGYYDINAKNFISSNTTAYNTYGFTSTGNDNENLTYTINTYKPTAQIYIDTSVTKSLADINLRMPMFMGAVGREDTNVNLATDLKASSAMVGFIDASADAANQSAAVKNLGYDCTSDTSIAQYNQYIATFNGTGYTDGAKYTIVNHYYALDPEKTTSKNNTYVPMQLEFHTYDKAALRAEINRVLTTDADGPLYTSAGKGINPQEWYYSSGYEAFRAALKDANTVLQNPKTSQTEIDAAKDKLTQTYNNLVLKKADYTELDNLIPVTDKIYENEPSYVESLIEQLNAAMADIARDYSILYQPSVNEMTANLQTAIDNMKLKDPNFTNLSAALNQFPLYAEKYYTTDTYSAWKQLYDEGSAILNGGIVTVYDQELIDQMALDILTALENLVIAPADFTALEAAMNLTVYDRDNYADESKYDAWAQLFAQAEIVRNDTTLLMTDMADIDLLTQALTDAYNELVLKDCDMEALYAAIALKPQYQSDFYTLPTYSDYNQKLASGVEMSQDESLTILDNDAVAAKAKEITDAFNALALKPATTTELETALALTPEHSESEYTGASYKAYQQAVEAGRMLLNREDLTIVDNEAINAAAAAITEAFAALALKPTDAYIAPEFGTDTVIDRDNGLIYGLKEGITSLDTYVEVHGGELKYTPSDNGFGTGTKVEFVVDGAVAEVYYIVIFGDLNGDGFVDVFDQALLTAVANYEDSFETGSAYEKAAELSGDGIIDVFDLSVLTAVANGEAVINQASPY